MIDERYKGIKPEKLPRVWFKHYVVYKYSWAESTYIVGFDSDQKADEFQTELLKKRDIVRCEIFGHYPLELLV
jgi:hypothetical protein